MVKKKTHHHKFSISESLKFGFGFFKKNLVTFLKLGGVLLLINILSNMVTEGFKGSTVAILWALVSVVISLLVQIGSIKILLELYDEKKLDFKRLYDQSSLLVRYFLASILYGLIVVGGFILLILPGIYFAIKYQFYSFLIVDKNMGVMDSLKKSSQMTEGVKWQLFLFGLALAGINILGALLLLVGLVVTIPATMMASVYVYRKLL